MSPFALLFIAIQQRIKAITVGGNPAIPWIDQDLHQIENHSGDNRPPVSWPGCTIDIDDTVFENMGENTQTGICSVCIRIAFPPYSASSSITPAAYRNKALYFYDLENAIHLALQGWSPGEVTIDDTTSPPTTVDLSDIWGHMVRTRASTEQRNDLIRVRALMYSISMDDTSTQTPITYTPVTYSITAQIVIP